MVERIIWEEGVRGCGRRQRRRRLMRTEHGLSLVLMNELDLNLDNIIIIRGIQLKIE